MSQDLRVRPVSPDVNETGVVLVQVNECKTLVPLSAEDLMLDPAYLHLSAVSPPNSHLLTRPLLLCGIRGACFKFIQLWQRGVSLQGFLKGEIKVTRRGFTLGHLASGVDDVENSCLL